MQFLLLVSGMAVYACAASTVWGELTGEYSFSGSLAILLVLTPPLIVVGVYSATPTYPAMLWFASVSQFFTFYFLKYFHNIPSKTPIILLVLIPLIVGTCVHVVKTAHGRIVGTRVFTLLVFIMLLLYTEFLVRSAPRLNHQLSPESSVLKMWRNPERIPSLFKNSSRPNELTFVDRSHRFKKPRNVFRTICIGSSSTEGGLGSDWGKYSYPEHLEVILNEASSRRVEVINGGIGGATFFMLETHLKEVFLPMDPDLVIVYFGFNGDNLESRLIYDRMKKEMARAPFIKSAEELWAAMHLRWNPPLLIRGFLELSKSRLFMTTVLVSDHLRSERMVWGGLGQGAPTEEYYLVECIESYVKQGGHVVLIPEVMPEDANRGDGVITHAYGRIFKDIAEQYSGQGVYYKSVLDAFTPEIADSYLVAGVHMNEVGYYFLADQIAGFLYSENLAPRD